MVGREKGIYEDLSQVQKAILIKDNIKSWKSNRIEIYY